MAVFTQTTYLTGYWFLFCHVAAHVVSSHLLLPLQFELQMECCKDKIYYLIETLRRCKYKATAIHEILEQAWPEDCLSLQRIQEICKEIKDGKRTSLERIEGSGRPSTELRTTNID